MNRLLVNRYLANLFLKSNDLTQAANFWQDALNAFEKLTETKNKISESEQLAILACQLGEAYLQQSSQSDAKIFFEHAALLTANLKIKPDCLFLALDNLKKLYQQLNPSIAKRVVAL